MLEVVKESKKKPNEKFTPFPKSGKNDLTIALDDLKKQNDFNQWLMVGIIIVLLVSFVGFVIDSFVRSGRAYSDYMTVIQHNRDERMEYRIKLIEIENKVNDIYSQATDSALFHK